MEGYFSLEERAAAEELKTGLARVIREANREFLERWRARGGEGCGHEFRKKLPGSRVARCVKCEIPDWYVERGGVEPGMTFTEFSGIKS